MSQKSEIRAIAFDWAGTTVDYGSRAPAEVFVEIFRRTGVEITIAEARGPMGRAKRDHLATVLALPRVAAEWQKKFGRAAAETDIDRMYAEFLPLQKETLRRHSDVIPGEDRFEHRLHARTDGSGDSRGPGGGIRTRLRDVRRRRRAGAPGPLAAVPRDGAAERVPGVVGGRRG
jgi:phosphonoacetaldehyde hydrolase